MSSIGIGNAIIASMVVPAGLQITIWPYSNYGGGSATITGPYTWVRQSLGTRAGGNSVPPMEINYQTANL